VDLFHVTDDPREAVEFICTRDPLRPVAGANRV
jgi:hypothetical protein